MKKNDVAILDFGSSKITCMLASRVSEKGDFVIKAVGQSVYNGFDDSKWYEPDKIKDSISQAISQVEAKTNTTINEIYVGVPGVFCAVATSESSITFHAQKKIDVDDIAEIVKKSDIFKCGNDYTPLGGKPVYFILDDVNKTLDPVGAIANKVMGLVSFSYMKNYFRSTVSAALLEKGISKVVYVNVCEAQAKYVSQSMFCNNYSIVIDVGHITTNVMLCGGRGLLFQRTFSLGSGYLASDLCQVVGCDYPYAMSVLSIAKLNLEMQSGDVYKINDRVIDAYQTNEVIKARIGQIAEYVIKSFRLCDKEIPPTTPIILTGGGLTYLTGGVAVLANGLGKQVKVYESINPQTKRNEYTSCYGLIAEAVRDSKNKKSFLSLFRKK